MKIALVSNIYAHGKILQEIGTPLLLAAETLQEIESIDVYTHLQTGGKIGFTKKVNIIPIIDSNRPPSYVELHRRIVNGIYDRVVVNSMPTSQGNKNIANLLFLFMPIIWARIYKINVSVLYHNSPYLNDIRKLGYSNAVDAFRSSFIKIVERRMFSSLHVFFLLRQYAERIKKKMPNAKVGWLRPGGITGFTTLYLNNALNSEILVRKTNREIPVVLIYGSWGPQKDIATALEAVKMTKGVFRYRLVVAGDVNLHFPTYTKKFESDLDNYKEFIDERVGYVDESELYSIFINTDIIILPYNSPGGFSGVMSISMLFGLYIVVPEFDEYKEQASGYG
ncbi:MAG: hypothetical protein QXP36_06980, partial [Conexivisphaerales archaeon]